jgi:HK97 gp10 family phage protein
MKVSGFKELDDQLKALANPQTAYRIGLAAVKASAELLKDAWVAGAPYSERASTTKYWNGGRADYGHLRTNITIGPVRAQNVNAVVYKTFTGNAFWGYFLEYGTVRMRPHPWARSIVERLKGEFVNVQREAINAGLEEALARR